MFYARLLAAELIGDVEKLIDRVRRSAAAGALWDKHPTPELLPAVGLDLTALATGEPCREGLELDISHGEWLLNPGSVGQPRDGDPRASWLMLDLDAMAASFHRADYDVAGAAAAIRAARLPDSLAERLEYGQ